MEVKTPNLYPNGLKPPVSSASATSAVAKRQTSGITDGRLAELMELAYHSSSLDDMGDAIIELVEEVQKLRVLTDAT